MQGNLNNFYHTRFILDYDKNKQLLISPNFLHNLFVLLAHIYCMYTMASCLEGKKERLYLIIIFR